MQILLSCCAQMVYWQRRRSRDNAFPLDALGERAPDQPSSIAFHGADFWADGLVKLTFLHALARLGKGRAPGARTANFEPARHEA